MKVNLKKKTPLQTEFDHDRSFKKLTFSILLIVLYRKRNTTNAFIVNDHSFSDVTWTDTCRFTQSRSHSDVTHVAKVSLFPPQCLSSSSLFLNISGVRHCYILSYSIFITQQIHYAMFLIGYIRKSDLVVHERFHAKSRVFKCDKCERCFCQSGLNSIFDTFCIIIRTL